ncbi:hypothetical protein [Oerskovia turbata]
MSDMFPPPSPTTPPGRVAPGALPTGAPADRPQGSPAAQPAPPQAAPTPYAVRPGDTGFPDPIPAPGPFGAPGRHGPYAPPRPGQGPGQPVGPGQHPWPGAAGTGGRAPGPGTPSSGGLSKAMVGVIAGVAGFVVGAVVATVIYLAVDVTRDAFDALAEQGSGESSFWDEGWDETWDDEHGWDDEQAGGTIDDPWRLSDEIYTDEWSLVFDAPYEATAEILAHNDVNVPPAEGMEYWIVPVRATYSGPYSQVSAHGIIDLWFVDANGAEHRDGCGDVPDALVGAGFLGTDESAQGAICLEIPAGADGLWGLAADDYLPVYLTTDPREASL